MLVECETKKWGNSLGIIIPRAIVETESLKEHERVGIFIVKGSNKAIRKTFGILKGKISRPTEDILKEVDKEGWDE